jgi:hypothetical protein
MSLTVNGRKHDERCANAKSKNCKCGCHGKFHGLKSGIKAIGKDGKPLFQLQGKKTFIGTVVGDLDWKVEVTNGIETIPLSLRLDLGNHSPTGFAWGYGGSGPHQLAIAILAEVIGDEKALTCSQTFKWEKIATIPKEQDFKITDDEVLAWYNNFLATQKTEVIV